LTSFKHARRGWVLRLSDGSRLRAKVLVDGTELGDVAKEAGAEALADGGDVQDMTYVLTVKEFETDALIPEPPGYDIENYRSCCQNPLADDRGGVNAKGQLLWSADMMLSYGRLPDGHIMLNWPVYGNDIYLDYLDAASKERQELIQAAKDRALGFLYFIQHELGYTKLGIADDVYPSDDGLPF
jgi:hypothetical protein